MYTLYSVAIGIYSALIGLASIFSKKASQWWKGRLEQYTYLDRRLAAWEGRDIFWIHAASYGEFEMSWPLIYSIKKIFPGSGFVVSFYSPSGYENIHLDEDNFIKIYLPADLLFLQKKYLKRVRPKAFFFIKYEYWYNLMRALLDGSIPYYFVGTHIEKDSYILKPFFGKMKKLIASADLILAHSKRSLDILQKAGFRNGVVFGDMRVQRALGNKDRPVEKIHWPDQDRDCIIYGSVSAFELPYILKCIKKMPSCNHILAPHDVEELFFEQIRSKGLEFSRLSKSCIASSQLMVVDNYGQLKFLYGQASIAYIGGGFEKGPHNILEALVFGIPVVIGKNIKKFPLARESRARGLIKLAPSPGDIHKILEISLKETKAGRTEKLREFLVEKEARMDLVENALKEL